MAALPVASTSANPYITYLENLQESFYISSTPGFRARIDTLVALLSAALVLVFLHVLLSILETRRKRTGAVWFFRLVPRPAGRVLVTNFRLVADLLTIVNLSLYLVYVLDVYKIYQEGYSQVRTTKWRAVVTFMVTLEGWLISQGTLQAYLLTPEQYVQVTKPWLANVLFVGGTVAICATLAGLGATDYIVSRDLVRDYMTVQTALNLLAAAWTAGTTDLFDLSSIAPQLEALHNSIHRYRRCDVNELAFSATAALLITLANIGSLLLVRVLGRHISSSRRQIGEIADIGTDTDGRDTELFPPHPSSSKLAWIGRDPSQLTRADIRVLARDSDGAARQHAQNYLALRQAQSDLIYATCGFLINAAIQQSRKEYSSWAQLELSLLFFPWLYGTFILIAFACLNINRLSSLSGPADGVLPPGATDLTTSGLADVASLRGSTTLQEFFSRRTGVEPVEEQDGVGGALEGVEKQVETPGVEEARSNPNG